MTATLQRIVRDPRTGEVHLPHEPLSIVRSMENLGRTLIKIKWQAGGELVLLMTSILMIVVNQNLVPVTKAHQACLLQRAMFALVTRFLLALRSIIEPRASREADILVLRQQLLVLHRKWRTRLRLRNIDRLMLVSLYRLFPSSLYLRTESRYFDLCSA
jgi:hypothetical protein